MFKRVSFFVYGCLAYLLFLVSFLYAIAFVEGVGVPTRLDGAAAGPIGTSLLIDAVLLAVFAIQHSVMARRGFKAWWTQFVPSEIERSTFVVLASAALLLLYWQWRPLGGVVWHVSNPVVRVALVAISASGWAMVFIATVLINHFDLFGLRQVWLALRGERYRSVPLGAPGPYRFVRHPLYLGFLTAFWAAPTMTLAHLVFAVATTAYILIAIQLEERDLVAEHGPVYNAYRRRVPMLLPIRRRRLKATLDASQVVARAIKAKFLLVLLVPTVAVVALEFMLRR
jgi:protein-S-isoprenylcysteine O-methyltransferase Ste14